MEALSALAIVAQRSVPPAGQEAVQKAILQAELERTQLDYERSRMVAEDQHTKCMDFKDTVDKLVVTEWGFNSILHAFEGLHMLEGLHTELSNEARLKDETIEEQKHRIEEQKHRMEFQNETIEGKQRQIELLQERLMHKQAEPHDTESERS